jgi:hypothetical protein
MRVLCVGRHRYLSEHFCTFFRELGADTAPAVGMEGALAVARTYEPTVLVCDYELLATASLSDWERDPTIGHLAVIAVSLARRPGEAHLLDVNGIAGVLYLPTLDPEDGRRMLEAAERSGEERAAQRGLSMVRAPSLRPLHDKPGLPLSS